MDMASLLKWCITRHDRGPSTSTETKASKLSSVLNKVVSIVRRVSSFVATVKSVINFSVGFEKEHSLSFLPPRMVYIVEDMVSSHFLSGNSTQTYQHSIKVTKLLLQSLNIFSFTESMDERRQIIGRLSSYTLMVDPCFRPGQRRDRQRSLPQVSPSRI